MPKTNQTTTTGGRSAAEIEAALPGKFYVKRGDIMRAFGLTRGDMEALVPDTFRPDPNPRFHRNRFHRSQVMEVARAWERKPAA